jgi:hypothetical protein
MVWRAGSCKIGMVLIVPLAARFSESMVPSGVAPMRTASAARARCPSRTDTSGEIQIGIWLAPSEHSVHDSWLTRGESPQTHTTIGFVTARQRNLSSDTYFYNDGVTDSLTGDIYCTPSACLTDQENQDGVHWGLKKMVDLSTRGKRAVPIFFIIQEPHTDAPASEIQSKLIAESQSFLRNIDFPDLSEKFQ